jgi:hypothetical protein
LSVFCPVNQRFTGPSFAQKIVREDKGRKSPCSGSIDEAPQHPWSDPTSAVG